MPGTVCDPPKQRTSALINIKAFKVGLKYELIVIITKVTSGHKYSITGV